MGIPLVLTDDGYVTLGPNPTVLDLATAVGINVTDTGFAIGIQGIVSQCFQSLYQANLASSIGADTIPDACSMNNLFMGYNAEGLIVGDSIVTCLTGICSLGQLNPDVGGLGVRFLLGHKYSCGTHSFS